MANLPTTPTPEEVEAALNEAKAFMCNLVARYQFAIAMIVAHEVPTTQANEIQLGANLAYVVAPNFPVPLGAAELLRTGLEATRFAPVMDEPILKN